MCILAYTIVFKLEKANSILMGRSKKQDSNDEIIGSLSRTSLDAIALDLYRGFQTKDNFGKVVGIEVPHLISIYTRCMEEANYVAQRMRELIGNGAVIRVLPGEPPLESYHYHNNRGCAIDFSHFYRAALNPKSYLNRR